MFQTEKIHGARIQKLHDRVDSRLTGGPPARTTGDNNIEYIIDIVARGKRPRIILATLVLVPGPDWDRSVRFRSTCGTRLVVEHLQFVSFWSSSPRRGDRPDRERDRTPEPPGARARPRVCSGVKSDRRPWCLDRIYIKHGHGDPFPFSSDTITRSQSSHTKLPVHTLHI